tara:strand:+ start:76 stop:831 length:756 start_codon:yes stop_codon:yes gene_type:complete
MSFPLPIASQEHYTKWFKHEIKSGPYKKFKIMWVGQELTKRFKSDLDIEILPENVFICKKRNVFEYLIIDKNEDIYKLPKKHYTTCFPAIQYNSIPANNKIKVKISKKIILDLPFIPQSFLEQKRNKTSRKRRRLVSTNVVNDKIDFDEVYPQWHVLHNYQNKDDSLKKQIMLLIRSLVKHADANINYTLKDPFESIQNINDIKNNKEFLTTLKIIVSFIFNYCRSELGIVNEKILYTTMSEWILKMNSID